MCWMVLSKYHSVNVTWSSGNTAVATVNSAGLVTAVAGGSATITGTTASGSFTATSTVTVSFAVSGVSVSPSSITLQPTQTTQLIKTITPANAANQNVTWGSNNTSIASVDNNGTVTAIAEGTATVTVTTVDGSFTAQAQITVNDVPSVSSVLEQFAFQYKYDGRKRMTHKKVPGAEWVYMVYDNRDRLVMTQDGVQRGKQAPEWTFTKYDELNRPVLTGIYKDMSSRDQSTMQTDIDAFYVAAGSNADEWFEVREDVVHGYSNQSFPKVETASDFSPLPITTIIYSSH